MLRCSTNNFCLKNYNYKTKEKPTEQRIERKQGMWGLTSPKTSLLQCKINGGWNMTPGGRPEEEREPLYYLCDAKLNTSVNNYYIIQVKVLY